MTTDRAQADLGQAIQRLDSLTMYLPTAFHDIVGAESSPLIADIRKLGLTIERLERSYCETCCDWRTSDAHKRCTYEVDPVLEQEKIHEEWNERERVIHNL
jgi:hypothetical protein